MADYLPILCLDFDGVIHDYREGWKDGVIYGDVTPGFFDWALHAVIYFRLVVYSSRSKDPAKLDAMVSWLEAKKLEWFRAKPRSAMVDELLVFEYAHEKPAAFLTIDDRAITFNGNWDEMNPERLRLFQPWMKKEVANGA